MSDRAKAFWWSLAPKLYAAGALTQIDSLALRMLCEGLEQLEAIDVALVGTPLTVIHVNKAGNPNEVIHPLRRHRHQLWQEVLTMLKNFGMTPATRGLRGLRPDEYNADAAAAEAETNRILGMEKRFFS